MVYRCCIDELRRVDYRILGWWTWLFPGLVLALLLVAVNLLGDALDEALNPAALP